MIKELNIVAFDDSLGGIESVTNSIEDAIRNNAFLIVDNCDDKYCYDQYSIKVIVEFKKEVNY